MNSVAFIGGGGIGKVFTREMEPRAEETFMTRGEGEVSFRSGRKREAVTATPLMLVSYVEV